MTERKTRKIVSPLSQITMKYSVHQKMACHLLSPYLQYRNDNIGLSYRVVVRQADRCRIITESQLGEIANMPDQRVRGPGSNPHCGMKFF